tara:strand:- start:1700 stop:2032 length:333 start_codon:yes stop_codon:yes gene_type:complete
MSLRSKFADILNSNDIDDVGSHITSNRAESKINTKEISKRSSAVSFNKVLILSIVLSFVIVIILKYKECTSYFGVDTFFHEKKMNVNNATLENNDDENLYEMKDPLFQEF